MRSHLLHGKVRHRRSRPVAYELEHDVFYLALDLDEIDAVARRLRLFSRDRRNVLSFHDRDHWPAGARPAREGPSEPSARRRSRPRRLAHHLHRHLRVFGYEFNPASFYLCRDGAGDLRVVVVEVHNTHGERRLYTLQPQRRGQAWVDAMDKDFYVSPFIDMDARYTVRVQDDPTRLRIAITETERWRSCCSRPRLVRRGALTDRMLARLLLRIPFATHKTIGPIHLHAWRLWRRGVRFHRHSEAPGDRAARRPATRGPCRPAPVPRSPGASAWRPRSRIRIGLPVGGPPGRRRGGLRRRWRAACGREMRIHDRTRCGSCSSAARSAAARRTWTASGPALTSSALISLRPPTATRWRCRGLVSASRPAPAGRRRTVAAATRAAGSRRNIAAHYDLGNDFYRLWLDETMTYSSAVFEHPTSRSPTRSANKYRAMAELAGLEPGQHVLEIGTGWGGFALYAAGELGCRVTTVTISQAQHDLARERVAAAGLADLVDVQLRDYRDIARHLRRDRLDRDARGRRRGVLRDVLRRLRRGARPGGRMSLQAITFPDDAYGPASRRQLDPDVHLPGRRVPVAGRHRAVDPRHAAADHRACATSRDYALTLRAWRTRFLDVPAVRRWASTSASSACGTTTSRSARLASRPA